MKKYLILFASLLVISCNDQEKRTAGEDASTDTAVEPTSDTSLPPGNVQEERDALQTDKEMTSQNTSNQQNQLEGRYKKVEENEAPQAGRCEHIDVNFDRTTDLCIVHDKVYITARMEKAGDNTANIYFVRPKQDENNDREIPWEEFDSTTPIAVLSMQQDGVAELDWKGFSTNGAVSTDYAIYGKKTLEGAYKKE